MYIIDTPLKDQAQMVVGVNLTGRGEEIYEVANSAWKQLLGTKFLLICRQKRDSLVCTGIS